MTPKNFKLVTPRDPLQLPPELALLTAPVLASQPGSTGEFLGQTEGVLVDADRDPVAFLVRLPERLVGQSLARTFVRTPRVAVDEPSTLRPHWSRELLLPQPRLDRAF